MADLISKQQVCEVLAQFAPENYTKLVEMLVVKLPAVEAVPVVRCKDCIFYGDPFENGQWLCLRGRARRMEHTDFCSYGERREENG